MKSLSLKMQLLCTGLLLLGQGCDAEWDEEYPEPDSAISIEGDWVHVYGQGYKISDTLNHLHQYCEVSKGYEPCGGDPVGRWNLKTLCQDENSVYEEEEIDAGVCEMEERNVSTDWSGEAEFTSNMIFSVKLTARKSGDIMIPACMFGDASCAQYNEELPQYNCVLEDGECICHDVEAQYTDMQSYIYDISDRLMAFGYEEYGYMSYGLLLYCVKDDELFLNDLSGDLLYHFERVD